MKSLDYLKEHHGRDSIGLSFTGDGSIVLKKGSTTLQKTGSTVLIKGDLLKSLKGKAVEDIGLVQRCFTA